MGRGLTKRGLRSPWLVVTDGAPGLIRAVIELWPDADRQRCNVHRLRNVLAKLPKRPALHKDIRSAYWAALNEAQSEADAEQRLRGLVGRLLDGLRIVVRRPRVGVIEHRPRDAALSHVSCRVRGLGPLRVPLAERQRPWYDRTSRQFRDHHAHERPDPCALSAADSWSPPKRPELHKDIRQTYWAAMDEAQTEADTEQRLGAVVGRLERASQRRGVPG
jgi:hypothetical protein